jgi:tetratricopeptide (TPR) repeat protein
MWWPLCIATCCEDSATLQLVTLQNKLSVDELLARSPVHQQMLQALRQPEHPNLNLLIGAAALQLAQARAPDHPRVVRIKAWHDKIAGHIDEATRVERAASAIQAGHMQDTAALLTLLQFHIQRDGLRAALAQFTVTQASAQWAYNFGCRLDANSERAAEIEQALAALPDAEREAAEADLTRIMVNSYEQGRARFEQYFATGQGHPCDAEPHLYSMLCNNLAIQYKVQGKHAEAMELHQCGITASPFAEHYDGVFNNCLMLQDHAAIVQAAEALWHFVVEHGYGRFDVNWVIPKAVTSLSHLERTAETPIWLERLVQWQQQQDEENEAALSTDALWARLRTAYYLDDNQSDMASTVFTALYPQIRADDSDALGAGGDLARVLGRHAEAIDCYQKLLNHPKIGNFNRESLQATLEQCEQALNPAPAPKKSGWKFWK